LSTEDHWRRRRVEAATTLLTAAIAAFGAFGALARGASPAAPPPCGFAAGARVAETLRLDARARAAIPITHVVVIMQENRSFDHYFGRLAAAGQPDAEGFPERYVNMDAELHVVRPFHLPTTCLPHDPPHQWAAMRAQWNAGAMDGFVTSADDDDGDGRWAMGYYDQRDIPFYYWLASTFSLADRHFAAALGGTWPNRQLLYTGTAQTSRSSTGILLGARTIFDALDDAGVSWRVYKDGTPHQDCIGWKEGARGVEGNAAFFAALHDGTLPSVTFVDSQAEDEHPPADVQKGEGWTRTVYEQLTRSPLWPRLAAFLTYDEGGGFFDHVPPPSACPPDASRRELDRRGTRVPLIVLSPWARPHAVSHVTHDHASILRFIELLHDLPALTARDANADAMLDMFDFSGRAPMLKPPAPPAAGAHGCRPVAIVSR
jgi:phospholipase C